MVVEQMGMKVIWKIKDHQWTEKLKRKNGHQKKLLFMA